MKWLRWLDQAQQRINDTRIQRKMIISFIFVVFIPVILVGVFLTVSFRQTMIKEAIQQTVNSVNIIKKRLSDTLRMPMDISNKLLIDPRLKKLVNTQYENTYDLMMAYRDYNDFLDYTRLYKEVYNIRFYTRNPTILDNWYFLQPNLNIISSFWYKEAMSKKQTTASWYYIEDETKSNQSYLSLIRRADFLEYQTSGVLVVDVNPQALNDIVSQELFDTMIYDTNGYIIAAKNTERVGKNLRDIDYGQAILDRKKGIYDDKVDGKPSKVMIEELVPEGSITKLNIVSVFSVESIVRSANQISILGFLIISISLVIALVLIYASSRFLVDRLLRLNKDLNKVTLGNLHVTTSIGGNDEIGLLAKQFNNMVSSIRQLMEEVNESNRQKSELQLRQKEIKLKMLASQINPHFLFNALESVRMKAHMHGEQEIAVTVKSLGMLLRKNLGINGNDILLKDEIEISQYYLDIQTFRFEDRLAYDLAIDPACRQILIPPLIVQPLVENAVIHGLEGMEEGGIVCVKAMLVEEHLHIEVTDNGIGISHKKMQQIIESLQDTEERKEHRIGLRNVHQRLILTYGENYGLHIYSEPGSGTRIFFSIPIGGSLHV
ncbi:sensor histidine kinase [Paenibacillus radicis (ex Xue et al. 2023)]|uniref:Sensor histidine kinase n=1 Tax=Paenibacillus radicis (ex Xue et al. 2023) TaxID=2972489 RepID=A0ABT1YBK4_9BACL|nr:sensor histidine kinase [Paenibacillus radicis (ex Xue et al. 2023)]MCR8630572.1 sensor histidine kinase [Paenibacillus radicis (ex Xue et al. 2023)]